MFYRKFRLKWLQAAAAAILLLTLAIPNSGAAEELDEGELMTAMEKSFIELVRTVLVVPVQESGGEPNFAEAGKRAGEIVKIAAQLPLLENYKSDNAFRNYAAEVENLGKRLADLIQKKKPEASVSALVKLRAACLQCHQNFRF